MEIKSFKREDGLSPIPFSYWREWRNKQEVTIKERTENLKQKTKQKHKNKGRLQTGLYPSSEPSRMLLVRLSRKIPPPISLPYMELQRGVPALLERPDVKHDV